MKKRTILFFVLAFLFAVTPFFSTGEEFDEWYDSLYEYSWEDAIYVENGKILPENEGKLVAVAGTPEMIEGVYDEEIGVHFPSPSVYRAVNVIKYSWLDNTDDKSGYTIRRIYAGKSEDGLETETLVGRVSIGEFELDKTLITQLVVARKDVTYSTFSEEDMNHMLEYWNESSYSGRFCITEAATYLDLDNIEKEYSYDSNNYEGSRIVWWNMWIPSPEDKFTVVGIQKGKSIK